MALPATPTTARLEAAIVPGGRPRGGGCLILVQRLCQATVIRTAALVLALGTAGAAQAQACPPPALRFEALAPGLWWVPGQAGNADNVNRGHVAHLLIGVSAGRVWALGSGPTAAFGASLRCQVRRRFGREISDVIAPWPHPELVLGQRGLPAARSWAHADVASSMAMKCDDCVRRLRERLGEAATDLGAQPVRLPQHVLRGEHGRLGPWRWWRLDRAMGTPVTVWHWRGSDLVFAPGVLGGEGAPDGRDADIATLATALDRITDLSGLHRPPTRWLGEQGRVAAAADVRQQAAYWRALMAAATEAVERGDDATAPAPVLPGLESMSQSPQHALNWQRAWRQSEALSFQRSRR